MVKKRGLICKVEEGSIAEQAGIEKGDVLLSVNGQDITDIFDYRFFTADENILVAIRKPNGETWEIDIEKDPYEDLGIEFDSPLIDQEKSCRNKCIFCFIDQLPPAMRDTLYFKDDDARLSFLTGNYVTLTNCNNDDLERIIKYKLSPVNISVHATDPEVRRKMMNNRFAGKIMEQIALLTKNNITVNCQLVVCKGINDGKILEKSIQDLAEYYPDVNSISVVPVGLTAHREKLFPLEPFKKEEALEIIHTVEKFQERYLKEKGSRIVFIADEFYVLAEKDYPDYDAYESFPQLENGVGLLASFEKEFNDAFEETQPLKKALYGGKRETISIATGKAAENYIRRLCQKVTAVYPVNIQVFGIENRFFGTSVTVAGLLTGQDIAAQLIGKDLGSRLLLPETVFRAGERTFLDDMTLEDLEKALKVKVVAVRNNGEEFLKNLLGVEI